MLPKYVYILLFHMLLFVGTINVTCIINDYRVNVCVCAFGALCANYVCVCVCNMVCWIEKGEGRIACWHGSSPQESLWCLRRKSNRIVGRKQKRIIIIIIVQILQFGFLCLCVFLWIGYVVATYAGVNTSCVYLYSVWMDSR